MHFHVINASIQNYNSRIEYEEDKWIIYDGNGRKSSTNGTWLFVEDDYELVDGTMFKAADVLFKVFISTDF